MACAPLHRPGEPVSYKPLHGQRCPCVGPICRRAVKAKLCARYGCGELPLKAARCFCSAVSHGQRISHQPLLSAFVLWLCRADSSKERQEQARCQTWKLRCMSLGGDMSRKVVPRSVGFPLKSLRTSQQIRFQPSDFRRLFSVDFRAKLTCTLGATHSCRLHEHVRWPAQDPRRCRSVSGSLVLHSLSQRCICTETK